MLGPDLNKSLVETATHFLSKKFDSSEIRLTEAGRLECPRCNIKSYANRHGLFRHLRYECGVEGGFSCDECTNTFKLREDLQRHVKNVHRNERNFPCPVCTKRFKRNSHLQKHLKTVHHML